MLRHLVPIWSTRAVQLATVLVLPGLLVLEIAVSVERWGHELAALPRLARRPGGMPGDATRAPPRRLFRPAPGGAPAGRRAGRRARGPPPPPLQAGSRRRPGTRQPAAAVLRPPTPPGALLND